MGNVDKILKRINDRKWEDQFFYEIDCKSFEFWNIGVVGKRRFNLQSGHGKFKRKAREW